MNEPLDFCRVKKIDEKGFGFLKSLYYSIDIFFHFSQIKKEEFLEKLNDMKRGEFFLYYTSKITKEGKRKVSQIWYSLDAVPVELYDGFIDRIIKEFNEGSSNVYDLLFVFGEMKKMNLLTMGNLLTVLSSSKILRLPTVILPYLDSNEIEELKLILKFDELEQSAKKPFWYDDFLKLP
jgi:hypothetical protein